MTTTRTARRVMASMVTITPMSSSILCLSFLFFFSSSCSLCTLSSRHFQNYQQTFEKQNWNIFSIFPPQIFLLSVLKLSPVVLQLQDKAVLRLVAVPLRHVGHPRLDCVTVWLCDCLSSLNSCPRPSTTAASCTIEGKRQSKISTTFLSTIWFKLKYNLMTTTTLSHNTLLGQFMCWRPFTACCLFVWEQWDSEITTLGEGSALRGLTRQ